MRIRLRPSITVAFRRPVFVCLALSLATLAGGCAQKTGKDGGGKSGGQSDVKKDLSKFHFAYSNYVDGNGKGPADWQTLIDASPKEADAIKRLRDGGTTVKWGTTFRDATEGTSKFELARAPDGTRLMLDGGVGK